MSNSDPFEREEKKMKTPVNQPMNERRRFFLTVARATGLAILGGLTWSAYVDEVKLLH